MTTWLMGSAQWGMDYGITNAVGRLSKAELESLLALCRDAGIDAIDTAPTYGDAQVRIGTMAHGFSVQTKVNVAGCSIDGVLGSLRASLLLLGRDRVRAVLVHDWPVATPAERSIAVESLNLALSLGLADAVGVSVYDEADLIAALNSFDRLDVVQAPVNVLDQRLEGSGAVSTLRGRGGRLQARSVLLQGVLATGGPFAKHDHVRRWSSSGLGVGGALAYVESRSWVDEIVIGVSSPEELRALIATRGAVVPDGDWSRFASADAGLIDPRRWT